MKLPNYNEAKKKLNEKRKIICYEDDQIINKFNGKTYVLRTYGCQMNEHDSENIKALIEQMGFTEIDNYEDADMVILNTCSIRENAHNKVFGMIGRLKHLKETKDVKVGICGCMSQEEAVAQRLLKEKAVDFVFGTHNLYDAPKLIDKAFQGEKEINVLSYYGDVIENLPVKRENKFKAYVNIIFGCNKFCTYCIVPFTRGRERSRDKDDIINEVKHLKDLGYKEITLLGQNVNAYGKDLDNNYLMADLLKDVAKIGIPRITFMTSHPWDFTPEMIDVISKYDNIMPYIHLPFQSGSSHILKRMNRRYNKNSYLQLVKDLKAKIPNLVLSTDIIVAFPGESDEDFNETLELVDKIKFDNAFSFIYSPRENTPAAKFKEQVDKKIAKERLQILNHKLNAYFYENNKKLEGSIQEVLVNGLGTKEGYLYGYTHGNKLINFKGNNELIGEIVKVEVTKAKTWSLDGKLLK